MPHPSTLPRRHPEPVRAFLRAAALMLVAMLASCGTIMRPGPFQVPVDSEPRGATVYYRGAAVGVTPCVVPMKRASVEIELELAGHHRQKAIVPTSGNGWLLGNVLLGGIIGVVVDIAAGGTWVVADRPIKVPLAPSDQPEPQPWKAPRATAGSTSIGQHPRDRT